jgi:hypothetical protein
MRFCRLMLFFRQELKIVQIFRFWGHFGPKCTFSTFDLENDGQGNIFSRLQYQKRVVSETLKILSYHTFRSDVWLEL